MVQQHRVGLLGRSPIHCEAPEAYESALVRTKGGAPVCDIFVNIPDTVRVECYDRTFPVAATLLPTDLSWYSSS